MSNFISPEWDWDEVIAEKGKMFHSLSSNRRSRNIRVDLVQYKKELIPLIILDYGSKNFKGTVNNNTAIRIVMDIVTVLPYPTPFAYIIPVIFDKPRDPYWIPVGIHLFPIDRKNGMRLDKIINSDYVRHFRIIKAFCLNNSRCAVLIIIDGVLTLAKIVHFDPLLPNRKNEINEVISFLQKHNLRRAYEDCIVPFKVFEQTFVVRTLDESGNLIMIPSNRSERIANQKIFPLMVEHERLIERNSVYARKNNPVVYEFDLFISYAHSDHKAAWKLVNWLTTIWPEIKISISEPQDLSQFKTTPSYFLDNAKMSRIILYLVTRNSINARPMVDTELGVNTHKPIISVLCNEISLFDLENKVKENLFLNIDLDKAIVLSTDRDGKQLANLIAQELDWQLPKNIYPRPEITIEFDPQNFDKKIKAYFSESIFIRKHVQLYQTTKEADRIVMKTLEELCSKENIDISVLPRTAQDRLLILLLTLMHESDWSNVLERVPALLDNQLTIKTFFRSLQMYLIGDKAMAKKMIRLLFAIRKAKRLL